LAYAGWAKKLIPLVHYIVREVSLFGPPCIIKLTVIVSNVYLFYVSCPGLGLDLESWFWSSLGTAGLDYKTATLFSAAYISLHGTDQCQVVAPIRSRSCRVAIKICIALYCMR